MRRRRYAPTLDGLESRRLMGAIQPPPPPPYVSPMAPGAPLPDPNPGDSWAPPGDYRPTNPGLC